MPHRSPESNAWNEGGAYGGDVNFPVPQAGENDPKVTQGNTCTDRNA